LITWSVDRVETKASKDTDLAFLSLSAGGGLGGVNAIQMLAVEIKMQGALMNRSMVKGQGY